MFATLRQWRRHLHAHPELSCQEQQTSAFVAARLEQLGIPFVAGIGGNGLVATLQRGTGASVGLRADMDALPIREAGGAAHASRNEGIMHACGHDGHTTSLLGALWALNEATDWQGTVRAIFQPAEEGYGGAQAMIADGLFTRFPVHRIFAFHNWPGLAAGSVAVHAGPVMAAGGRIRIVLRGRAGHAAMPHLTRDPVLAAAHVVVALQSVVARGVDPLESAVVSICAIEGGSAGNQIPEEAELRGTFRAHRMPVYDEVETAIRRVTEGVAAAMGMQAEISLPLGVCATVNEPGAAAIAAQAAVTAGLAVQRDLPPSMAGEDFGFMLGECPGAFAWIGNGPSDSLHHPGYDFNDAVLPAAVAWLASVARESLARPVDPAPFRT